MTEDEYEDLMERRGRAKKPAPKPSKYNSKRIHVDGVLFDSKKEADYYGDLKLQLKAGAIKGFCRQPEFILTAGFGNRKPVTYKADFIVFNLDGTADVIDVKGVETEVFKIKKKLFADKFPELELKIEK
jgi:hypothetical protein